MNDTQRFILTSDGGAPLQLLYMSANNGIIASFDGQTSMFDGVTFAGVLSKAYLGYSNAGRSLSARGSTAAILATARVFSTTNSSHIGYISTQLIPFSGHIKSLVYYLTRLIASEI